MYCLILINVLFDFNLSLEGNKININVPTFPEGSNSNSYKKLKSVRRELIKSGGLFFRDLFVFSEQLMILYTQTSSYLEKRFPIVFLDEMQDTQKFQDELLQKIFPLDSENIIVQRFGDPDQAIFNGINGEEPNTSYNGKPRDKINFVIDKSHRFDVSISQKIRNLSFNEINLDTDLSDANLEERKNIHTKHAKFKHTIFIYCEETIGNVIPAFADLCSCQFSEDRKKSSDFTVKIVGAVGNEIKKDKDLKITSYYADYSKEKSSKNFKETHFIEAVYYCRDNIEGDWKVNYKLLSDCILKLLYKSNIKNGQQFFTKASLKQFLVNNERWSDYRAILHKFLDEKVVITSEEWESTCDTLLNIFEIKTSAAIADYIEYIDKPRQNTSERIIASSSNVFEIENIKMELSTIHGVKGETHDATLVLETKYRSYDLEKILPYLSRVEPNSQIPKLNNTTEKFMRQLYVAMSRPRHLLCLAIHKDRITENQEKSLYGLGWNIEKMERKS
ncbi:MAG: UvrD-helicase domain-containing protein [Alphaproteobacteria bacterium]|nr:UvrD-helicase domain-containing protein [Alphaproteobacteria bacterium]